MESSAKLYALKYTNVNTYLFALLFIVGNILLPQVCHLAYLGGPTWLPIYFFTLIGAYKYGMRVGLLTALLSPVINSWLFGMPALAVLPAILVKSVLLALAAGFMAQRLKRVTLWSLLAVVLSYQVVGTRLCGSHAGFQNRNTGYAASGIRRLWPVEVDGKEELVIRGG